MPALGCRGCTSVQLPLQCHPGWNSILHCGDSLPRRLVVCLLFFFQISYPSVVSSVMDNIQGLGYPPFATPPFQGQPQSHIDTAKLMSNSWVSFFVDQNPNTFKNSSAPQWPVYNNGSPVNFVFDANVTSHAEADTFRQAGIAVINSLNIARGV